MAKVAEALEQADATDAQTRTVAQACSDLSICGPSPSPAMKDILDASHPS
jgi:hypothetical protein